LGCAWTAAEIASEVISKSDAKTHRTPKALRTK
jgi:hypothetical protein